jgi:LPS export ABC transporter protein LptC
MRRIIKACSIVFVCAFLLPSCTQQRVDVKPASEDPYLDAPQHISYNIDVLFIDSANTKANLDAGVARMYEDRKETTLGAGMRIVFYDSKSGSQAATLTADSAIIDDRSRNMTAIGNVVVISDSNNRRLETQRLVWDHATEEIRTNENVVITTPTEIIEGQGLVSDQYLTAYRIFNVRGIHKP